MIKGKEQCLVPEYILKFLEKLYLGIVPENYGQRMVSKKLLSKMNALYHFYSDYIPSNFGRLLCPEYLIEFIEKIDLIEYTDEDTAYIKEVPEGSLKYALINVLGGMSYKSENLLVLSDVAETTLNGITYSVSNGILTISGTASVDTTIRLPLVVDLTLNGDYILAMFNTANVGSIGLYDGTNFALSSATTSANTIKSGTLTNYNVLYFNTWISNGSVINASCKPMLVTGSTAPTTFKQGFEGIRDSAVTSVVANSILNIPAGIQALEGYGWGIDDTCYNYIDFENKKFVQKVSRIIFDGTENWEDIPNFNDCDRFVLQYNPGTFKAGGVGLSDKFEYSTTLNTTIGYIIINAGVQIVINFSTKGTTTLAQFKTWLSNNNVVLNFELATPVETDISSYITDNDKFLEVEPLGTITFNNTYEQEVPSTITYLVEV